MLDQYTITLTRKEFEQIKKKYIICRVSDNKFYKHTRYGGEWVDDQNYAKVYNQINHAKSAITTMKTYKRNYPWMASGFHILVFEVVMVPKETIIIP